VDATPNLIASATSEQDLTRALAHQMPHVAVKHLTPKSRMYAKTDYDSIPLISMGLCESACPRLAKDRLVPRTIAARWEAYEPEADRLAAEHLEKAGFATVQFSSEFEEVARRAALAAKPQALKKPSLRGDR
jgi:predicted Zn-dependent protease